jgi:hypothetical protein
MVVERLPMGGILVPPLWVWNMPHGALLGRKNHRRTVTAELRRRLTSLSGSRAPIQASCPSRIHRTQNIERERERDKTKD